MNASRSRTSIRDVAREAGVTAAVVSRVLNSDPTLQVRQETRDRVREAARHLDYVPNHAAQALRQNRSAAIGLAVHDITNPVYSEIVAGAQLAAAAAGYVLLLADVDSIAHGDERFRRSVHGGAIDGLLLQRAGTGSDRRVVETASAKIPTVLVNDRSTKLPSAGLDDRAGTRLATQHLIDLGHTKIAHLKVGGTGRSGTRAQGWRDALGQAGLPVQTEWLIDGGHTVDMGHAGMQALLELRQRPTAVVAGNVLAGIGAMTAIRDAGLRVPDDLSVVAFHDVVYAAHLVPALTTVRMPLRELGSTSVTLLLEAMAGAAPRHVVVNDPAPTLIIRDSTAPAR